MDEYRFEHDLPVPAGRVIFRIRNVGSITHRLAVVPLPEDFPPIQEQLLGTERRFIGPVAGIYERRPGSTGTFAVDLAPGQRYAMICFVVDLDEKSHAVKGMTSEFRAGEESG